MRQAKLNKTYESAKNIVERGKDKIEALKKEIAYLEMRQATGTENKFTLIEMLNKKYNTDSFNDQVLK